MSKKSKVRQELSQKDYDVIDELLMEKGDSAIRLSDCTNEDLIELLALKVQIIKDAGKQAEEILEQLVKNAKYKKQVIAKMKEKRKIKAE